MNKESTPETVVREMLEAGGFEGPHAPIIRQLLTALEAAQEKIKELEGVLVSECERYWNAEYNPMSFGLTPFENYYAAWLQAREPQPEPEETDADR